ncbi:hypothetical protein [Streptomyces roseochromogenus]|uniref:Uncharacterized protein n=1 Tax=Streptomyces roseochromogenus subsp. oscitans DS 12.976 TaxID=1352936 RepID=V6K114_STRRC|nr:hypothetical protein [Streptomyces roseochromogenus]EST25807.1 hypothetical protein M878_28135 [Streptomyces roseochromogenus subsp. oscitans DS 12.976]
MANPGTSIDTTQTPTAATATDTAAVTTVTAHFKLVFLSVTLITVLTLAASLYIGIFVEKPTEAAKSAMDTCSTLANLGFGAMVGLLGGKAVN